MKPMIKRIIERALVPTIIRYLPNGIRDQIIANKVLRNISSYTLQSADIYSLHTDFTNLDYAEINKPLNSVFFGTAAVNVGTLLYEEIGNVAVVNYGGWDSSLMIGKTTVQLDGNHWGIGVTKGFYADLAAAKIALAGKTIYYQLATPLYESYNGFPPSM